VANTYFQFKEFIIHQQKTAMKVTTDACLFGAWLANTLPAFDEKIKCLDIGAGTGLLSLMCVQKHPTVYIDAIEIDALAVEEATENVRLSKWNQQVNVVQTSIQTFKPNTKHSYQWIISNPPFYDHDLKSQNDQRNLAHHSTALSLETLVDCIDYQLANNGYFAVLLPHVRSEYFIQIAEQKGLYIQQLVQVKQTEKHAYFRTMFLGGKVKATNLQTSEITVKINNEYSQSFIQLLKDYYLHL